MSDEPRKDLVILAAPWARVSARFRENAAKAGEIRTVDNGALKLIDGLWEVMESGDLNEADIILNALRPPN